MLSPTSTTYALLTENAVPARLAYSVRSPVSSSRRMLDKVRSEGSHSPYAFSEQRRRPAKKTIYIKIKKKAPSKADATRALRGMRACPVCCSLAPWSLSVAVQETKEEKEKEKTEMGPLIATMLGRFSHPEHFCPCHKLTLPKLASHAQPTLLNTSGMDSSPTLVTSGHRRASSSESYPWRSSFLSLLKDNYNGNWLDPPGKQQRAKKRLSLAA